MWNFFHKDWLLQLRIELREQLPADYRVFVESESVLVSPSEPETTAAVVLPDIAVVSASSPEPSNPSAAGVHAATSAIIEAEETWESETHYSLVVRREPDNQVVAAMELLSPSNKGLGNRLDRERHLRKRDEYLDAGISLLELDPLLHGERDVPEPLARLTEYQRIAWTAYHLEGRRKYRGWGWNQAEPLPQIDWRIDATQTPILDLSHTLAAAIEFNRWEGFVADRAKPG